MTPQEAQATLMDLSRKVQAATQDRQWATRRVEALERADGICQHPDGCGAQTTDVHHRKGRTGALMLDLRYLVALCRPHHHRAHLNPDESYANGLMMKRND